MRAAALLSVAALASPAVSATGAGYPTKKLVSSSELQKLINIEDLLAGSQKLQDFADSDGGQRAFGGKGHIATTDWLYTELKKTGYYDVVKQPFVELFTAANVNFTAGGTEYPGSFMTFGPRGDLKGTELAAVSNLGCDAADYPAEVSGKIAVISRGVCPFGEKSAKAKVAGAVGAVIYNNVPGSLAGTLGGPGDYPPTIGVTQDVGAALAAAIAAGPVLSDLFVDQVEANRTSYNIIAETKGGDHNNVLVLGGHSDSVYAGPGINDDGSGTIGVFTVAKALTNFSVKNAVRFAFWSAEEFGLLGSKHYLRTLNGTLSGSAKEVAKVRAYLNFDMIASPNYVLGIYDGDGSGFNLTGPAGSDVLERDFELFYESKGLPHVPAIYSGRSDYAAFLENGIPSGGLFTGAEELKTPEEAQLFGGEAGVALDVNYHEKGDDINNLALDAYLINTQSIANSVAKYALSFDGIPLANHTIRKRNADRYRYTARFDSGSSHNHAGTCGQTTKVAI